MKKLFVILISFFFLFSAIEAVNAQSTKKISKKVKEYVRTGEDMADAFKRGVKTYKQVKETWDELRGVDAEVKIMNGYSEYSNFYIVLSSSSDNCEFLTENNQKYLKPGAKATVRTKVYTKGRTNIDVIFSVYEYDKELNDYFFTGMSYNKEFHVRYSDKVDTYIMNKKIKLSKEDEKKKEEMKEEKREKEATK